MEASDLLKESVIAITTHFAKTGAVTSVDWIKDRISEITSKDPKILLDRDIDELALEVQKDIGQVGRKACNEETLARYLEIPVDDLDTLNPDTTDWQTLQNHMKLEEEFSGWLKNWATQFPMVERSSGLTVSSMFPTYTANCSPCTDTLKYV